MAGSTGILKPEALTKDQEADKQLFERSLIETALPAHMMVLMSQSLYAARPSPYRLRPDIVKQLNNAAAVALTALGDDFVAVQRCARITDEVATKLLFKLSPDDPVHGFYSVAMFCLVIAEEGYFADVLNMSVLVSTLIIDDIKQAGGSEQYTFKERILIVEAKKILHEAQREGYYRIQHSPKKAEQVPPTMQ